MTARSWPWQLGCLLAFGCSFVDDFDKFRALPDTEAGISPATEEDADVTDAAVAAEDAADGSIVERDAEADASTDAPAPSVCGDRMTDFSRGEQCDDGNQVAGDGCEPVTCMLTPRPSCGNGKVDSGEACDGTPGCRPDCQTGCKNDADCSNDNPCDGVEKCAPATALCGAGARPLCVDTDRCTQDGVCDPASGCVFAPIDRDGDGYAPGMCASGSTVRGNDCDDGLATVSPSATERCNGIDDDCDGMRDEGFPQHVCYPDLDGDGFPNMDKAAQPTCMPCATGEIMVADATDRTRHDCWDDPVTHGADAHPGQQSFFEDGYGPGGREERRFDYDCNGKVEPRFGALTGGCGGLGVLLCTERAGFQDEAPPCGEGGAYTVCTALDLACSGRTESRKQSCR